MACFNGAIIGNFSSVKLVNMTDAGSFVKDCPETFVELFVNDMPVSSTVLPIPANHQ